MKNISKFLLTIFLLIVFIELFWFFKNDGNLIVYIQNQSDKKERIKVRAEVNKEQIFYGELNNNEIIPQEIDLTLGLGRTKILVSREDNSQKIEKSINLFLVNWLTVDLYKDEIVIENHFLPPLFQ